MPTDVLIAFEKRRAVERTARQERRMGVLLLPVIMALLTILLSVESHAVECGVIATGLQ